MTEIARAVGVSKNAVSLALAGKPGVSAATRARIVATAERLGYEPVAAERRNKAHVIVVVPEYLRNDGAFYSEIFWAIEHEIRKSGAVMLTFGLSAASEQQLVLPETPDHAEVIGYLAIGVISPRYLQALADTGRHIVTVDIRSVRPLISSVCSDNLGGAQVAVEYLIAKGHTHIGFAGPVYSAQSVFERWCGYRGAMLKHDISPDPSLFILGNRDRFELLDSEAVLEKYLSPQLDMPTAWFCAGDLIALSLMKTLNRRGIRVPTDVSIIGFDDLAVSGMVAPALTTIRVDRKLMGREAVRLLLAHYQDSSVPCRQVMLPCSIVERESVRPVE